MRRLDWEGARQARVVALALLALTGCGVASDVDGGPRDAAVDAARLDAGPADAGVAVHPLRVAALPAGLDDVAWLGPAVEIDLDVAFDVSAGGAVRMVLESADVAFDRIALFEARGDESGFGELTPMALPEAAVRASPTFVDEELYYESGESVWAVPTLHRVAIDGAVTDLPTVPGVSDMLAWPRFVRTPNGVGLAFRDGASTPSVALGPDASSLGPAVAVDPTPAAQPALAVFGDGGLAFSYQRPIGVEPMVSFFRTSAAGAGGQTWSDATRVSDRSSNVHDTAFAARADGGLDAYYIYPLAPAGFVLFRRAIAPDGALGVEERLTASEVGEPSKPHAVRLPSGRVLVAFADIAERDAAGQPSVQRLGLMLVEGEAPAPP